MTTNAAVHITAEDGYVGKEDPGAQLAGALYDFDRVQVSFPAEDGYEPTCKHCGSTIEEHTFNDEDRGPKKAWVGGDGSVFCDSSAGSETHEPETGPGTWCNSASISVDEEDDAVHVSISVGDPRGAFVMTVRKVNRSGYCKHCGKPIIAATKYGLLPPADHYGPVVHEHNGATPCDVTTVWDPNTNNAEPDGERYMLHVPYEGMGFEHMPMEKLSEGTFLVG